MELIGGTKIFFQVFSNLFDYFIFKLYFHTVVFKDSLSEKRVQFPFLCRTGQKICSENLIYPCVPI